MCIRDRITIGNRKATQLYPVAGVDEHSFVQACLMASLSDETPEGKSIVELGRERGVRISDLSTSGSRTVYYTQLYTRRYRIAC